MENISRFINEAFLRLFARPKGAATARIPEHSANAAPAFASQVLNERNRSFRGLFELIPGIRQSRPGNSQLRAPPGSENAMHYRTIQRKNSEKETPLSTANYRIVHICPLFARTAIAVIAFFAEITFRYSPLRGRENMREFLRSDSRRLHAEYL